MMSPLLSASSKRKSDGLDGPIGSVMGGDLGGKERIVARER